MTKQLIRGLQKFHDEYYLAHRAEFEQLAHGQHPRVLFITCSDSRIDPTLITQVDVGEIFVIRNAGNIIPPFGAANGGEGATLEYALNALDIREIVVCGHSHCGAMKGLLKLDKLEEGMPLVYNWLKHTEATRRVLQDSYSHCDREALIDIAIAENVLTQLENLRTYPVVRSKLHRNQLALHGWIYNIEAGEVLAYDPVLHEFVSPDKAHPAPEPEYNLHASCPIPATTQKTNEKQLLPSVQIGLPGRSRLSTQQADRIYRGSR
ncbi:carbonic anhydrase [Synechococcus sp. PCC 7336]|uniref:carbonic anhydrase n=1 Tax=Synechococcus sp. PCC 7336 TaxID=195250 RepID=UPI000346F0F7|nr:carbonic anhydrase [Synechococcus sp. PCC 7336]